MRLCIQCGKKLGFADAKIKLRDAVICPECFDKLGLPEVNAAYKEHSNNYLAVTRLFKNVTVGDFNSFVQSILHGEVFSPWYVVGNVAQFDDRRREAHFAKYWDVETDYYSVPYDNILDVQLDADNVRMHEMGLFTTGVQDYTRRAKVDVLLKGPGAPRIPVWFIRSKTKRNSLTWRDAATNVDLLIDKLFEIIEENDERSNRSNGPKRANCAGKTENVGCDNSYYDGWGDDDDWDDDED